MALSDMSCDALSREQRIPLSVPSSAGYVLAAIATVFALHVCIYACVHVLHGLHHNLDHQTTLVPPLPPTQVIVKYCMSKPTSWAGHMASFVAVFSLSTFAICFWRTWLPEGQGDELKDGLADSTVAMVMETAADASVQQ